MKRKPVNAVIVISAIAALTILELAAMYYGINGTMRAIIFALIAGMAGLSVPTPEIFLKKK